MFSVALLLLAQAAIGTTLTFGTDSAHDDGISKSADVKIKALHPAQWPGYDVLSFELVVHNSTELCGQPNITVNGNALSQEGHGILGAKMVLDHDSGNLLLQEVVASWEFACVSWNGQPRGQIMTVNIESIAGQPVQQLGFSVRFRQVEPLWIDGIDGPAELSPGYDPFLDSFWHTWPFDAKNHRRSRPWFMAEGDEQQQQQGRPPSLVRDMAELRSLKLRQEELKMEIDHRERQLEFELGKYRMEREIADCDTVRCCARVVYRKVTRAWYSLIGQPGMFYDRLGPDETAIDWYAIVDNEIEGTAKYMTKLSQQEVPRKPNSKPWWCKPRTKPDAQSPLGSISSDSDSGNDYPEDESMERKPVADKKDRWWKPYRKPSWDKHPLTKVGACLFLFIVGLFHWILRVSRRKSDQTAEQRQVGGSENPLAEEAPAQRNSIGRFFSFPFRTRQQDDQQPVLPQDENEKEKNPSPLPHKGHDEDDVPDTWDEKGDYEIETRTSSREDENLTMAGELASFRAVADLVSEMIAAEEGRAVAAASMRRMHDNDGSG